jgi:hypothetical protein
LWVAKRQDADDAGEHDDQISAASIAQLEALAAWIEACARIGTRLGHKQSDDGTRTLMDDSAAISSGSATSNVRTDVEQEWDLDGGARRPSMTQALATAPR